MLVNENEIRRVICEYTKLDKESDQVKQLAHSLKSHAEMEIFNEIREIREIPRYAK